MTQDGNIEVMVASTVYGFEDKLSAIYTIEVKGQSPEPLILKNVEKGNEKFYIRRHASTVTLTMFEFFNYVKEHWIT